MDKRYYLVSELRENIASLNVGDEIYLSGTVYTARDAAHMRMAERNEQPFPFKDGVIYYAGPTPTPPGRVCGSFGPTTSARMDKFAPALYGKGIVATIGKGDRSKEVIESIVKNKCVYFSAIGGAGALISECVTEYEEIAYLDLGCESVKRVVVKDFPLVVAIDSKGRSIYDGN